MRKKELPISNKTLVLTLGALLPLGMNISHVLDGGMTHDLMYYAAFLIYLLAILLVEWYVKSFDGKKVLPNLCYIVTVFSLSIILVTNVQTANTAYIKKDLERQATLSVMTTVNADINRTEGYVVGETEVKFIGSPQTGVYEIFPNILKITGLGSKSQITYEETYYSYYKYILQTPLNQSYEEIPKEITDEMPVFPKDGYIKWYDGILIVKMSE